MRETRSAAVAGLVLATLLLGGCGTQHAPRTAASVTPAAAEQPSASPSPTPPPVDERALEKRVATLVARSAPIELDFLAPTRDEARGSSRIRGHRLADVMASNGLDPLPEDADVWVARAFSPTLGKLAHPNSRDGTIAKPLFDHEVVWVLLYRHMSQGPVGGRSISDPPPASPTASPSLWYSDEVCFIKPDGFVYGVTVG